MLNQHLEDVSHPGGRDQPLQLQPGLELLDFPLPRVIDVRELIGLTERQQESLLRCEPRHLQPFGSACVDQRTEIPARFFARSRA